MAPDEWQELALEELCSSPITYGVVKPGEERSGGVPFIRGGDFPNGQINQAGLRTISASISNTYKRTVLKGGEVLISLVGYPGATTIVPPELSGANIARQAALVRPKKSVDTLYLYQFLTSEIGQKRMLSQSIGSAQQVINLKDLRAVSVLLPPLPEQQKIAEILGTWDKAIQTTEALLTNARTQKRALMQSLLTGTRRFPGFEDHPWREVRLGDVLREVNKPVDWSDDELYRLVSVRRRSGGVFHREDLYGHQILTKTLKHAHAGDFLISKMQVVHGAMALVTQEFDGMQISGSYISLVSRDHNKLDIRFFDWLSRTQDMYRRAYQCSYGVHIEKMTFNFGLFLKEMVPMPSSVDEQIMIADALDTAQAEEHWFEVEAERLRTEKKSLMQQLLTGKRRVVV